MLTWKDIIKFTKNGNLPIDKKIQKTDLEWKRTLSPLAYMVTRQSETEKPFSSQMCSLFEPGKYACICCSTLLFDSTEKFESNTGWPSFTNPINDNLIAYYEDNTLDDNRIETRCNICNAHLGHVFPDGPLPSGLRFCINSAALKKVDENFKTVVLGGGCFWCTEAIFQNIKGVISVESGYSGGTDKNPNYENVSNQITGHAEVIKILFDSKIISLSDIVRIHLTTHNPTTLNKQGADEGTQYRSIIFYNTEEEKETINKVVAEIQKDLDKKIVTEVKPFEDFFNAEDYHQDFYSKNKTNKYCQIVIDPKISELRRKYAKYLK